MGFLQFTKKNPNPYRYFLQSDECMREHKIKMGTTRLREHTVNRAWSTNRIPTAHSAKNEFWVMRDRSEKDLIFN